jgi:hypothetical protein
VLCQRLLAVIAADRFFAFSLLLLPLVLSLLAHAVPVRTGLGSFLLVLIFGSAFLGSASSVRELVKERAIYQRERAIGLSLRAYLGSKLIVLGVIAGGEAVVFALLGMLDRGGLDKSVVLGSGQAEIVTAAVMVAFASMVIGLVISAGIRNADRGMPLLVVVVMVQLILSDGFIPVSGRAVLEQLSWLVPAQWGHAMVVSTINPAGPVDTALWRHDQLIWVADAGAIAGLALALVMITGWLLRRLDPRRVRV